MRRQGLLITAALAALAFAAASAFAAGGITVVKHTTATVDGPSARKAKCDKGDHVLGGGFASSNDGTLTQQSYPSKGKGWKVETLDEPGGESTAYALCEKASARKLQVVSNTITVPRASMSTPVVERTVKAKCPKGWQVLSGGYAVKPPYSGSGSKGEIAVDTTMRADSRTWKVHGGNDGKPTSLRAYAICEKQGKSDVEQAAATDDTIAGFQSATANCPDGAHIVGGGYQIKPNELSGAFPRVIISRPVQSNQWQASWVPTGASSDSSSITSYAECES
jgi:hypothetical protein